MGAKRARAWPLRSATRSAPTRCCGSSGTCPPPRRLPPTVLGGDDWAIPKGRTYGTILVDLARRREIQAQGFAYSLTNVQRFVHQLRCEGPPPASRPRTALTKPQGPPPRHVAALLLRRPERRTEEQRAYLQQLGAMDPTIAIAVNLAADFLVMLRRRDGARLLAWLEAAEASGISALERFARTLREDLAAVQAGLTLRYSNGQTEGHATWLKLVKRQGYGRAKFDLLRKRVLWAA